MGKAAFSKRLTEEVIFFNLWWKVSTDRGSPSGIHDWRSVLLGLLPPPLTPLHFPSHTFLILTRELPLSQWEKRRRKTNQLIPDAIFAFVSVNLLPLHTFASYSVRPTHSQGEWFFGLFHGFPFFMWEDSFLSLSSSWIEFRPYSRVIKKVTCPSPSRSVVFLSSFYVSCSGWTSCVMSCLTSLLRQDRSELLGIPEWAT